MEEKVNSSFIEGWWVMFRARTVFATLLIIAMLVNVAVFIAVKYGKLSGEVILPLPSAGAKVDIPAPEGRVPKEKAVQPQPPMPLPPTPPPGNLPVGVDSPWLKICRGAVNIASIVSIISVVFLIFCSLVGLLMIIVARSPGAGAISASLFWAVGIVVLVLPWSGFLPFLVGMPTGGVVNFDVLVREAKLNDSLSVVIEWLRYGVYPLLIVLFTVVYLKRTSQANLDIMTSKSSVGKEQE